MFAASVALYSAGLSDDEVFSLLALNPWAFEVALDHRRQDSDRALMYLWVEHCQKGKAKSNPVASLADFENLVPVPAQPKQDDQPAEVLGDAADFDIVQEDKPLALTDSAQDAMNTVATKKQRFEVIPADQFAGGKPPTWIVKGLLPKAELNVLFGESGSGKSFVALDLAGAIARGIQWRGRKVKQGRVVYVAAEGAGGFRNRLNAYAQAHELDLSTLDLGVIKAAPNLMVKDDALDVCKAIIAGGPVSVVIIDTFAQVMPGANENMRARTWARHCSTARVFTKPLARWWCWCTTRARTAARGHGAGPAYELPLMPSWRSCVPPPGACCAPPSRRMVRTGWSGALIWARAAHWCEPEDGEVLTSCVVREAAVPVPLKGGAGANKNGGKWAARVLEVLGEFTLVQTTGIEKKAVLDKTVRRSPGAANESNRRAARRALDAVLSDDGQADTSWKTVAFLCMRKFLLATFFPGNRTDGCLSGCPSG
ncbi:AAA family ATPase [Rhodoferax sp.]|uniref:AAA family ATPase n=1 Tax=Rhodoferax sp. TaxID=50421 RepID=UPI002ACED02A|nr:AAA family ATPase [Rhodoferax sp.]MDZ7918500.1 AAA family ATPase [Rhodoferax sp.]